MGSRERGAEDEGPSAVGGRRPSTVVLVVREGTNPRRPIEILRWVRALVPAALILVAAAPLDVPSAGDDVVTVNVDDVEAGPLAIAAALARPRGGQSR